TNAILVGPNGVGKSTLARNIAHQALIHGHTVLFTSAGQLLCQLAALDSDSTLRLHLRHYAGPRLLVIDEVGYLSYSNRHAHFLSEEDRNKLIALARIFYRDFNESGYTLKFGDFQLIAALVPILSFMADRGAVAARHAHPNTQLAHRTGRAGPHL